jgi:hypothetical protein
MAALAEWHGSHPVRAVADSNAPLALHRRRSQGRHCRRLTAYARLCTLDASSHRPWLPWLPNRDPPARCINAHSRASMSNSSTSTLKPMTRGLARCGIVFPFPTTATNELQKGGCPSWYEHTTRAARHALGSLFAPPAIHILSLKRAMSSCRYPGSSSSLAHFAPTKR